MFSLNVKTKALGRGFEATFCTGQAAQLQHHGMHRGPKRTCPHQPNFFFFFEHHNPYKMTNFTMIICTVTVLSVNEHTPFEQYHIKQYLNEHKNYFPNVEYIQV